MSCPFDIGSEYTRNDIYDALGLAESERRGDWLNGYHRHEDDYYIFCNVGVAGRTGHDYDNHWEGETLVWHGKTKSTFSQESNKRLLSGAFRVLIFYRTADRAPFTFAGVGAPLPHFGVERPVRIDWTFGSDVLSGSPIYTDEYVTGSKYKEGQRISVLVSRYERDRRARDACIRVHGATCQACGMDFEKRYGELGKGFIHVHHVVPVSRLGAEYALDPISDLIPVCPNCHSMLHRTNPPLLVADLRRLLQERKAISELGTN